MSVMKKVTVKAKMMTADINDVCPKCGNEFDEGDNGSIDTTPLGVQCEWYEFDGCNDCHYWQETYWICDNYSDADKAVLVELHEGDDLPVYEENEE